jgi:hypothetical protein
MKIRQMFFVLFEKSIKLIYQTKIQKLQVKIIVEKLFYTN